MLKKTFALTPRRIRRRLFFLLLAGSLLVPASPAKGADLYMQLGPGFLLNGGSYPGIGVSLFGRLSRSAPAFVGVDLGAFFNTDPFGIAMPCLASFVYRFKTRAMFKPWLGFSVGPIFGGGSGAATEFAIFFKPGVYIEMTRDLDIFLEGRLGLYGSHFAFFPIIGGMFRI